MVSHQEWREIARGVNPIPSETEKEAEIGEKRVNRAAIKELNWIWRK